VPPARPAVARGPAPVAPEAEPAAAPDRQTADMERVDQYNTKWESAAGGWSADGAEKRLDKWRRSIRVTTWAHGQLRSKYAKYEYRLSVVLVSINAIISSSVFTSIVDSPVAVYLQVLAGVMSMVAAVLTAWKTELKWAERAEAHRSAERGFEKISHLFIYKLELTRKCPVDEKGELIKEWKDVIEKWEELEAVSPSISPTEYAKFKKDKEKWCSREESTSEGLQTVSASVSSPSEAAPDRRAASPRSPTPPPPPPSHLAAVRLHWPALPTRAGHGPETNIPAWGRECLPPQG